MREFDAAGSDREEKFAGVFAGFDAAGQVEWAANPESGTITYTYKPNDLVETVSDGRGIVRTYGYNTRNLTTNVSYNDGGATPSVTFGYDEFGSRTSMADGEGTTTYVYNGFRQLQSESRGLPNGRTSKLTYTWNLADQAKQVTRDLQRSDSDLQQERQLRAQQHRRDLRHRHEPDRKRSERDHQRRVVDRLPGLERLSQYELRQRAAVDRRLQQPAATDDQLRGRYAKRFVGALASALRLLLLLCYAIWPNIYRCFKGTLVARFGKMPASCAKMLENSQIA